MSGDLISQLRDIHYPPKIPLWPLALGWYFVIAIILLSIFIAGYFGFKYLTKRRLRKIVLQRLDELQNQQHTQHHIAEELSMLLRRAALAIYPRQEVAGLYGEKWLSFLDKTSMSTEFTQGDGRLLISCPYQEKNTELTPELFHLIKNWVKKNL